MGGMALHQHQQKELPDREGIKGFTFNYPILVQYMAKVWPFTFLALIIIMVLLWYVYSHLGRPTHTITIKSTTIRGGGANANSTTTIIQKTTYINGSTTTIPYINPCNNMEIMNSSYYGLTSQHCSWNGGRLGLWAGAGNASTEQIIIRGDKDGKTYLNQTIVYSCMTFVQSFYAPGNQTYNFSIFTGGGGGSCGPSVAKLNTTLAPPNATYYNFVYNGNFQSGYTGWNVTGKGFGAAPLNVTYANAANVSCYLSRPWSGFNSTMIATTFNCGLTNSPGNLTSQPFKVTTKPYLNFKLISPKDNYLYLEILYNGTPYIIAHYNTYNPNSGGNSSSTLVNASIPLVTLIGKVVQVRVVADTLVQHNYIAVSDFQLSSRPLQANGLEQNFTIK